MKYIAFILLIIGMIIVYSSKRIINTKAIRKRINTDDEEELLLKSNGIKLIGFAIALIGAIIIFNI